MPTAAEWIVIGSEIALALHPILLKTVNVPLLTQLVIRLGTYSALGTALAEKADWKYSWGSWGVAQNSILFGLMNLVHIGSSYASYKNLSAGSSLALFYTYPFMNILAGVLFLGETVSWIFLPWMCIAFIGVLCISYAEKEGFEGSDDGADKKHTGFGIAMALLSAFTETLIFLLVKTSHHNSPFLNVLQLYPAGLLALLGYSAWKGFEGLKGSPIQIGQILAFNIFIGFIGYCLRFYSIPRMSTVIFSILTFIGVVAGYSWGLIFAGEKPSWLALIGSGCITGSVAALEMMK